MKSKRKPQKNSVPAYWAIIFFVVTITVCYFGDGIIEIIDNIIKGF